MAGVFRHAFRRPSRRRAFFFSIPPVEKIKILAHPDALGATSVRGAVFLAPSGSDLTGAKLGEFSGKAFGAVAESGFAVLKVPVSVFGGEALGVGDAPVCIWTGVAGAGSALIEGASIGSVGPHACSVILE